MQHLQEIYRESKKDVAQALLIMKKALELMKQRTETEAWHKEERISLLKSIAACLREQGKPQEAIPFLKQAAETE